MPDSVATALRLMSCPDPCTAGMVEHWLCCHLACWLCLLSASNPAILGFSAVVPATTLFCPSAGIITVAPYSLSETPKKIKDCAKDGQILNVGKSLQSSCHCITLHILERVRGLGLGNVTYALRVGPQFECWLSCVTLRKPLAHTNSQNSHTSILCLINEFCEC